LGSFGDFGDWVIGRTGRCFPVLPIPPIPPGMTFVHSFESNLLVSRKIAIFGLASPFQIGIVAATVQRG